MIPRDISLWSEHELHDELRQLSETINVDLLRPAFRKRGVSVFTHSSMVGFLVPLAHDALVEMIVELRGQAELQRVIEIQNPSSAFSAGTSEDGATDTRWD